jgi:hypothetical protein
VQFLFVVYGTGHDKQDYRCPSVQADSLTGSL